MVCEGKKPYKCPTCVVGMISKKTIRGLVATHTGISCLNSFHSTNSETLHSERKVKKGQNLMSLSRKTKNRGNNVFSRRFER